MESDPPQKPRTDDKSSTGNNPCCPECAGSELDESVENFDAVCTDCGYTIHNFSDHSESSIANSNSRTNNNPAEQHEQPGDWKDVYTVTNNTEQRVATAFEHLERLADALTLPTTVKKHTAPLVATTTTENFIDGRRTEVVVAALLYIAARQTGNPRPITLIAQEITNEKDSLDRLVRSLQRELDLEYVGCSPEEYLPYLCEKLGYSEDVEFQARQLIDAAQQAGLTNGKNPTGVAGVALYCASEGERSQREVATTLGISKETIRLRIKELREEGILHE